ncbi:MAG: Gfo/Idh/MocA family oxidoreductase [Kiritimatiellae bacterium]|nr:Gfo/Idh/MocA family oxidoreductase [Kiritimatiellia bacterium]
MKTIRVGLVGLGVRGGMAMDRLPIIPGVEVAAFCEIRQHLVDKYQAALEKRSLPRAREFVGLEAWRDLCAWDGIDVVYICSPWHLHVPIALAAMEGGKHALVEVPAAFTVDECWSLVETAERTGRYCMQLENCCYGEIEMLALNLAREGKLGDVIHGEGAYLHDLRSYNYNSPEDDAEWHYRDYWRLKWNAEHKGNQYCTHGLGPICQAMGVNRGDRLCRVVSMETAAKGFAEYAAAKVPSGDWRRDLQIAMGDMNTTLVQTEKGRTIMIQHGIASPRPYSRLNTYVGTRGILTDYPYRVAWEEEVGKGAHRYFDDQRAKKIREEFMHPQWKYAGKLAVEVGGHDGMDLIMDLRWAYCLQNGLPLDFDVYDLASWCCLGELTERSVREGSAPQAIPDFTKGRWQSRAPLGVEALAPEKMPLPSSK